MEQAQDTSKGPNETEGRTLQKEIDALRAKLTAATGEERHELERIIEEKEQARQAANRMEFFPS